MSQIHLHLQPTPRLQFQFQFQFQLQLHQSNSSLQPTMSSHYTHSTAPNALAYKTRADQLTALPSLQYSLSTLPQAKSIDQVALHQSTVRGLGAESEQKVRSFLLLFFPSTLLRFLRPEASSKKDLLPSPHPSSRLISSHLLFCHLPIWHTQLTALLTSAAAQSLITQRPEPKHAVERRWRTLSVSVVFVSTRTRTHACAPLARARTGARHAGRDTGDIRSRAYYYYYLYG